MSNNASEDSNGSAESQSTTTVRVASSASDGPMIVSSDMLSSAAKDKSSYPKQPCNNEAASHTTSTSDAQHTPTGSSCESIHGSSSSPPNSNRHIKNGQEDSSKDESLKKARADRAKEAPSASNAQGLFFPNACIFVGK